MPQTVKKENVQLHVENIGGITEAEFEMTPGVTILAGRNATNRTSLLQAIMAVLGSDDTTLKGDADEGLVELTIGETTYTRHLSRQNGRISTSGDPYLEDATLADLFAFLLESNDARQAVARGDDLRDIIMRPVDTGEIERQINQYQSQRDDIDKKLEEIDQLSQKIPNLESEKSDLQDEINEKREELSDIESEIDDIDEDISDQRDESDELEQKLSELNNSRSQLESVRRQLETQRESLDALKEERKELETDQKEYEEVPDGRLNGIEAEIQRLREQKDSIDSSISDLQTVIEFNEDLLDGSLDIFSEIRDGNDNGDLTDQLLEDTDDLVCWTCGNKTDTSQIETMLDELRDLREEHMEKRKSLNGQINDLNEERRHLEEQQRQRTQIKTRLETIADEIVEREDRIEELKEQRHDLTDRVESLENEAEELRSEDDGDSELIDLHKEANRLEVRIERLESDLESVSEELERIEQRVDERDNLETKRDEIQKEIEGLRDRVETIEQTAIEEFNTHMAAMLDTLSYDNLERIWIERTEEQVRDGRQTVMKTRFDLHIVRGSESGTVYEDTIDHLSESEREVTGLIFALAGYLVHDVHENVPFMLLDSVEAIDAPRLADLIDYFQDYAQYLVVALLEEDAEALDDNCQRISTI
jgi:DNA repair exonuclease SbcCD ATPase subunit